MQSNAVGESSHRDLRAWVLLLACALVMFHLGLALTGRGIAREQHLGTAVEYAKGSIDLLRPMIMGNNANEVPTPLEFPIWQAISAMLMKLFGHWYGWGNVVSLIFHLSGLLPIFHIARRLFSERAAWWAAGFYLAQPITFLWGGMASVDSTAASFALWFFYLAFRMLGGGGWVWWPAAAAVGILSATTKAPFFMAVGLALFFWLLYQHRRSQAAWLQLSTAGLVSVLAFALWNRHAHSCYQLAEFPLIDLRVRPGGPILAWWFGDLALRLNLFAWAKCGWRILTILLGSTGLVFLPLIGFWLQGTTPLRLWLLSGLCTMGVFMSLVVPHWHYYFMFSPAIALLCARAAESLEPAAWKHIRIGPLLRTSGLLVVSVITLAQGLLAAHLKVLIEPHWRNCGQTINLHTTPADKLIVWGSNDWSIPLLHVERKGLQVAEVKLLDQSQALSRLKELGYNKLVLVNPSPLLAAISTSSGSRAFRIIDLGGVVPEIARSWPVVFSSPSVLILDIPR